MSRARSDRGVMLILVALSILVLAAMSAFVIDNGIVWMSRRQAQNAADAGALAGALARLHDEFADPPASNGPAYNSAFAGASMNHVFGAAPGVVVAWTCPAWVPAGVRCVQVDTFRDGSNSSVVLPTYFANLLGVTSQRVRATATARIASGNQIRCMLPFAVIDRWADNFDDEVVATGPGGFLGDGDTGTAGWTPNDDYQPGAAPPDVYIGPYGGNTNHTGWRVTTDYGRQLILKDGSPGSYSAGWANTVLLPGSTGFNDVGDDIRECNEATVGIATAANQCLAVDEPNGCIAVQTGVGQGQVKINVNLLVGDDSAAGWVANAPGPNGPTGGAVVGGGGMDSPRIRPIAVVDINHYELSGCTGSTCVAKLANIIGFFVEGMCDEVTLDLGMACDPNPAVAGKEVVGRIVTLPAKYIAGIGGVEDSAAFLKFVTLIR